ncbi:MAG TPA: 30S ribosomal protein S17 [Bdellovibrionales bacterium]|nr:30S ribosomal protein S17 [Bdellovibrionales bacterium]
MAKPTTTNTEETKLHRPEVVGEVISDKMDKTIAVQVFRRVRHTKYGKYLKKTSVYKAHDEKNTAKKGDKVRIQMSRPLSKTKRWRLMEVVERGEQEIEVQV